VNKAKYLKGELSEEDSAEWEKLMEEFKNCPRPRRRSRNNGTSESSLFSEAEDGEQLEEEWIS